MRESCEVPNRLTLDALRRDPALAAQFTPEDRMRSLADAEAVAGVLRPMLEAAATLPRPEPEPERMLDADTVADMLHVTRRRVFGLSRRADWQSFTVRAGRKLLRFRERGFRRWLDRQKGGQP